MPRLKTKVVVSTLYVALAAWTALVLTPFAWLLAASLKSPDDLFHYFFFSPNLYWGNYRQLFEEIPFVRFLMNSLFISGATVMLQLALCSVGGFALAKYEFAGKKTGMAVLLCCMMIPPQVVLAPLYELMCSLRLLDSHFGLILSGAVNMFGLFLFRQYMLQIPDDLLEAGRIDGCSELRLFWTVMLPVCRPVTGALALIAFTTSWNSFLWPQIMLQSEQRFTLPIALSQLVGIYSQDYGVLMAGTVLSVLPVLLLFLLLQKEFLSGLTAGAVKG
jgi:multiple sugar transport system permease protein